MKRLVVFAAAVAGMFAFSTCDLFTEYETEYVESVTASSTRTWDISSSNFLEIDSSVLNVNITGSLGGKTLYYALVNPSEATIGSSKLRKVTSSSLVSSTITTRPHTSLTARAANDLPQGKTHFVGEKLPSLKGISARSALTDVSAPNYAVTPINPTVGTTTKEIYIDTNSAMTTYAKKTATLRATGTYCYVWVIDDYFTTSKSGKQVDSCVASDFATKFDTMYPVITHVFGNESNQIINYDAQELDSISSLSDTGEKINIVIYDIGNDYKDEKTVSTGGVVGYFYAKDYYYTTNSQYANTIIGKSNVGKYFYIDSGYAVSHFNDTISTLAHEFQHMVNFNQKDIKHEDSPDASYNEMLSMLCEDMMQNFLNLDDKDSPKSRIQSFNAYYFYSGIREYLQNENAALSYSTSYAFGAWLCRQYGGAALVKEIMANEYVDNESLYKAVNTVNGTNYSFDDLFAQFVRAIQGDSSYTLNKNASQTITYSSGSTSYSYPMTAINIFSTDSLYTLKGTSIESALGGAAYSGYSFSGPFIFDNNIYNVDLRPNYGIQLHGVGAYASGTTSDTVTFTQTGAKDLKIYLIIQ